MKTYTNTSEVKDGANIQIFKNNGTYVIEKGRLNEVKLNVGTYSTFNHYEHQ